MPKYTVPTIVVVSTSTEVDAESVQEACEKAASEQIARLFKKGALVRGSDHLAKPTRPENVDLKKGLPRAIAAVMEEKGWDISSLAKKSGLSTPTVRGLLEGNISNPHARTIAKITKVLGRTAINYYLP